MNARLYNPALHRFLEADNYLQDPYNTQNYNRYGYCVNNPMKYTDVTGNFIDGGIISAIVIGAIISAIAYTASTLINHTPFTFQGALASVVVGAFSGAATFGIGEGVSVINNFFIRSSVQSLSHGLFQAEMTAFNGGKFWSAFAAGAVSSIVSSAWQGGFSNDDIYHQGISGAIRAESGFGTIAFGTLSGGAASALTGGNFWQGAVSGLFVSGLNHCFHNDNPNKRLQSKYNRELKKAFKGRNVDKKFEPTPSGMNDGAREADIATALNIETISAVSSSSGNPSVKYAGWHDKYEGEYVVSSPNGTVEAAQPNQSGTIKLYTGSMLTLRRLANTILHELGHAYSRYTGYFLNNYNKMGWDLASNVDEVFSRVFANKYGVSYWDEDGNYERGVQLLIDNKRIWKK